MLEYKSLPKVIEHLEFLGYEVEQTPSEGNPHQFIARHASRPYLLVNPIRNVGLSVVSLYTLNAEKVNKNRLKALEIINKASYNAVICAFSIPENAVNFACATTYVGEYNKKQFADFLELFEGDINRALNGNVDLIELSK